MRRFASAAFGAVAVAMGSAMPVSAGLSGDYTLAFYSFPTHEKTATQCVTFTNTGGILGFPDSGTWDSSTVADWGGNFVVDGKMLRWYGTAEGGAEVTNFYNKIKNDVPGKGGFDDWYPSAPPITANNDGITTMRPGCRAHQPKHFGDPTR
jgi:hypothetical protein